ncbi:MAG: hypothetical protein OEZ36_00015 [Spirochaetota bacterium]|nr:hypothetical protein [Spirochaetota bacterium]
MNVGTYSPNFFGYSVTHKIVDSRRVLSALKGILAEKHHIWQKTSAQDKRLFLVEEHELAHHQLFSSTPCGLLLWRLNQVICRDILWAEKQAKTYGVVPPMNLTPRAFYQKSEFLKLLSQKGCPPQMIKYLSDVYKNIENCLIVRDIFFGAKSASKKDYRSLTLRNLSYRLNDAFEWMSKRCDLPWTRKWKIKGDPNGLVFSKEKPINCHDIAEAHAVAHELSTIRAYGDKDGFDQRYKEVLRTSYETGIEVGIKDLPKAKDFEFSPALLRHRGLLAFCTYIDLTVAQDDTADLFIEDHLPWLQFEQFDIFTEESHFVAGQALNQLITCPVYRSGSNWANLKKFIIGSDIQTLVSNIAWLGMDLQVNAFHRNAKTSLSYLEDYINKEDFAYDQVNNRSIDNIYLIEYSDSLFISIIDLRKVYKKYWDTLMNIGFEYFNDPIMQIICHLSHGAIQKNTIAHFRREQVPSPDIITPKLRQYIYEQYSIAGIDEKDRAKQHADFAIKILTRLIEAEVFSEKGEAGFLVSNHGRFIN